MFIFLRLLLAHFLGDFVFQTNRIYALKSKNFIGILPHIIIITLCHILFVWPFLHLRMVWGLLAFICITHLLQDWLKENIFKFKGSLWIYLADQILHIAAIMVVFLTPLAKLQGVSDPPNIFVYLYNDNAFLLYLNIILFASYNGFFLIMFTKKTFLKMDSQYTFFGKWYGIFERIAIVSLCFSGLPSSYFILLIVVLRPAIVMIGQGQYDEHEQLSSWSEISLSWMMGGVSALLLKILLPFV